MLRTTQDMVHNRDSEMNFILQPYYEATDNSLYSFKTRLQTNTVIAINKGCICDQEMLY